MDLSWASLPPASDPALAEHLDASALVDEAEECMRGAGQWPFTAGPVDYNKVFPGGMRAMAELERAVRSAALEPELLELIRIRASQINGWNRLAVGLRSDVLSLDGLDLPDGAGPRSASGSA